MSDEQEVRSLLDAALQKAVRELPAAIDHAVQRVLREEARATERFIALQVESWATRNVPASALELVQEVDVMDRRLYVRPRDPALR